MSEGLPDVYVRFEGIEGECMDDKHPGKAGWFPIKSFNFNFSVKDAGDSEKPSEDKKGGDKKKAAPKAAARDEGPLSHPDVSLSKNLDSSSARIWDTKCYSGQEILEVELEACRSGGMSGADKIPFVRLVFEGVYIKSISMSIAEDALPAETMQFSYERARIESIWTDNDTGERCNTQPRIFGWDFENHKQWTGYDE